MSKHHTQWRGQTVRRARAFWAGQIAATEVRCYRCGGEITPDTVWEVEHVDPLSQSGEIGRDNQAVSHRSCNRRHGQLLGQQVRRAKADTTRGIRAWL